MEKENLVTRLARDCRDGYCSLSEHLVSLLELYFSASNPLAKQEHFEVLSDYLKKNRFQYEDYLDAEQVRTLAPQHLPAVMGWVRKVLRLLRPARLAADTHVQNLGRDRGMLEQAGLRLPEHEELILEGAMLATANLYRARRIRFWGKFLGLCDYYVLQGASGLDYDDQLVPGQQPRGEGANTHTFWVTTDLCAGWVELPQVTAEQVRVARLLKHVVQGDLQAEVEGYPRFPGREKHFLKAQIARITHACELAPKGFYKVNDENPKELDFEEEYKLPELAEQASLQNWVHVNPYLLAQGRCSHFVDPTLSEEQRDALQAELTEKDPEVERLKAINEDKRTLLTSHGQVGA